MCKQRTVRHHHYFLLNFQKKTVKAVLGRSGRYVVHWNRLIPSFKWVSEYQSKKILLNYTNTQLIFNTVSMFLIDFTGLHLTQLEKKAQRKKKKSHRRLLQDFLTKFYTSLSGLVLKLIEEGLEKISRVCFRICRCKA